MSDDFVRLLLLHAYREASALAGELPEDDVSTRSFIPLPRFFHSRRTPPLLTPSLVLFPQRST